MKLLVAKNPLAMQESKRGSIRSLSPEDPLQEGTSVLLGILASENLDRRGPVTTVHSPKSWTGLK